jgi:hypothetical protein
MSVSFTKTEKYILSETAIHESSHYIIYEISSKKYNFEPSPISVSIIPTKTELGVFYAKKYGDWRIEVLTAYAGYASKVVFYELDARKVFYDMAYGDGNDFKIAKEALWRIRNANDIDLQFEYFKDTVEWVKKYKNNIQNFAIRLENQKIIKF